MRKVILSIFVSLDGFISGPGDEIDWLPGSEQRPDKEIDSYIYKELDEIDTILLGSKTYELFVDFWPTATTEEEIIPDKLNAKHKVVFSKTLDSVGWGKWDNARLAKGPPDEEVKRLKHEPGEDMVIFGSASLAQSLMKLDLIDEYRLFVTPIVLGSGKPLFENIKNRIKLKLAGSQTFQSGVVLLRYEPA